MAQIPTPMECLSHAQRKPYLVFLIAMVAAVGGFLFGYDLSIISGVTLILKRKTEWGLTGDQVGMATSAALLGCVIGPLLGGTLSDRLGRRKTLILSGLLFALGSIGTALPNDLTLFYIFRFVGGLGVGLASVASPMFIAEMSPARIRGALVTINQLAIVTGLACAVFVAYGLSFEEHWRWMLASNAVPVPIFILGLLLVPESPRWLVQKGRDQEARDALTLIDGPESAEREMNDIRASDEEGASLRELFRPGIRFALMIACTLGIFQQITGASIMTMYMPSIFKAAQPKIEAVAADKAKPAEQADAAKAAAAADDGEKEKNTESILFGAIMSVWMIVCTIAAMLMVDRLGRKPLLLGGTAFMVIGLALTGLMFEYHLSPIYVLIAMFVGMGAYLVSLAPLAWLIMSEIFPNRLRGKAMMIGSVCVWSASFLMARYFPPMMEYFEKRFGSPAGAFWVFAAISLVAFLFSMFVVPETKGRTLEEIGSSWTKKPAR